MLATGLGLAAEASLPHAKLVGQESAPKRHEVTITFDGFAFNPERVEVMQDDVVTVTITADTLTHSFTIDDYRISRRVAAENSTVFEFRADRAGSFLFYCSLTNDDRHREERGTLLVVPQD